jgi:hypothetical protein
VPRKKRRNFSTYSYSILPTITKNNNIFELQGFLKHNDFVGKPTNKLKIPMLGDLIKTNQ